MSEAKYVSSEALDAYTQALSQKLASKLSNIYTPKGSAIYADTAYLASDDKVSPAIDSVGLWQQINGNWTKLTEVLPGWVYNITNEFTTDANFVEGAGIKPAVGTNIVVVNIGTTQNPALKFDLLATGIAFDPNLIATKQNEIMSAKPEVVIPDLIYADAAARTADTTAHVSDGMITFQEDTEEYWYAEVEGAIIIWHDAGNTKTVEGAIKLISSTMPIKPISPAEIQAMFASS